MKTKAECPHCGNEMMIEFEIYAPQYEVSGGATCQCCQKKYTLSGYADLKEAEEIPNIPYFNKYFLKTFKSIKPPSNILKMFQTKNNKK